MRSDLEIVQLPSPLPNWGGRLGTNTKFTDPDFGTEIVRITDAADNNNSSLETADSGNAGIWNKNETLINLVAPSSKNFIFQFNPQKMQRAAGVIANVKGHCSFSTVLPGVLYQSDGMVVRRLKFKNVSGKWELTPISSIVCDFSKILPAGFKLRWAGTFNVSQDDSSFAIAFSEGVQNTAIYACVWQKGHGAGGYRMLNTQTGQIIGDWGQTGAIDLVSPDTKVPFTLHEFSQSPNPQYVSVGAFAGGSSPLIWDVPTVRLVDSVITGHRAKGWLSVYAGGPGGGQYGKVPYMQSWGPAPANTTDHQIVVPKDKLPGALGQKYDGDQHCGFAPISKTDDSTFWVSTQSNSMTGLSDAPFTSAWINEVLAYKVPEGIVYRACHTFNSGKSTEFIAANAIAVPSPSGKFIAFCSDGMGTLGSVTGAEKGTLGVDARADVFVARFVTP